VGVKVSVAYSRNKLALRTRLRNLNLKTQLSIFESFRDNRVHTYDLLKSVGGLCSVIRTKSHLHFTKYKKAVKNLYALQGQKSFFLPATFLSMNTLLSFTSQVTGIK